MKKTLRRTWPQQNLCEEFGGLDCSADFVWVSSWLDLHLNQMEMEYIFYFNSESLPSFQPSFLHFLFFLSYLFLRFLSISSPFSS